MQANVSAVRVSPAGDMCKRGRFSGLRVHAEKLSPSPDSSSPAAWMRLRPAPDCGCQVS